MRILGNIRAVVEQPDLTKVVEDVPYTEKIICNKCKVSVWDSAACGPNTQPFFHCLKEWGKKSTWDGEDHEFHLCEKCYGELIDSFNVPHTANKKCRSRS